MLYFFYSLSLPSPYLSTFPSLRFSLHIPFSPSLNSPLSFLSTYLSLFSIFPFLLSFIYLPFLTLTYTVPFLFIFIHLSSPSFFSIYLLSLSLSLSSIYLPTFFLSLLYISLPPLSLFYISPFPLSLSYASPFILSFFSIHFPFSLSLSFKYIYPFPLFLFLSTSFLSISLTPSFFSSHLLSLLLSLSLSLSLSLIHLPPFSFFLYISLLLFLFYASLFPIHLPSLSLLYISLHSFSLLLFLSYTSFFPLSLFHSSPFLLLSICFPSLSILYSHIIYPFFSFPFFPHSFSFFQLFFSPPLLPPTTTVTYPFPPLPLTWLPMSRLLPFFNFYPSQIRAPIANHGGRKQATLMSYYIISIVADIIHFVIISAMSSGCHILIILAKTFQISCQDVFCCKEWMLFTHSPNIGKYFYLAKESLYTSGPEYTDCISAEE